MLDKLYKYIEDNGIDLIQNSWNNCINGFLNEIKVKRHKYRIKETGYKSDITEEVTNSKLVAQINKLFRKGYIYLSEVGSLRFKSYVGKYNNDHDHNYNFGFYFNDYVGYFVIKYRNQSTLKSVTVRKDWDTDPIEFLKRFEFICSDPSGICNEAKIYSFNMIHKKIEGPAIEIEVINDEPQLNLIDPL